jgi:hypothetical protein
MEEKSKHLKKFFSILFNYLFFIVFAFTYMCIHYLGPFPTPHNPCLIAEPVLPSCCQIL